MSAVYVLPIVRTCPSHWTRVSGLLQQAENKAFKTDQQKNIADALGNESTGDRDGNQQDRGDGVIKGPSN